MYLSPTGLGLTLPVPSGLWKMHPAALCFSVLIWKMGMGTEPLCQEEDSWIRGRKSLGRRSTVRLSHYLYSFPPLEPRTA